MITDFAKCYRLKLRVNPDDSGEPTINGKTVRNARRLSDTGDTVFAVEKIFMLPSPESLSLLVY